MENKKVVCYDCTIGDGYSIADNIDYSEMEAIEPAKDSKLFTVYFDGMDAFYCPLKKVDAESIINAVNSIACAADYIMDE
jgi:hypothetical protein